MLTDKLPLFIGVIVLLGCLLLMVAFRSIVVPLTAAVMNLLAAGASFGVVTAIFQKGFLAEPLGVGEGPIEAVPAGDDDRDPVRALDGLPGVPREPHARGVDAHEGQRDAPCASARPPPAA